MAKTRFEKDNRNILLFNTSVENLFINELLPSAPGDYVKVYLFGLMNAEYEGSVNRDVSANVLGLSTETIEKAWAYWEDKGAVKRTYDPVSMTHSIRFISQLQLLFGGSAEETTIVTTEAEEASVSDEVAASQREKELEEAKMLQELELRGLYSALEEATGRPISRKEMDTIRDAIEVYSVTPDVFAYAIKYCAEIEKYNVNYISKVALRWTEDGCRDIAQVKSKLEEESKRNSMYSRIFREIGFNRLPSPADRDLMSSWMDQMGFSIDEILEACRTTAGMREPSLKYVNRVLENKIRERGGIDTKSQPKSNNSDSYQRNVSKRVLGEYYEYLRNNAELEYQEHLEEVRKKVPLMNDILALETEFSKAIMSFDFSPKAKEQRQVQLQKRRELEERKRQVLVENGYPEDYIDKKFKCDICKDTGVTDDGKYCSCAKERVNEAYTWNLKRIK